MQHVILVQFLLGYHYSNIGLYNRPKRAGFLILFSAGAVAVDIIFQLPKQCLQNFVSTTVSVGTKF